MALTDPHPLPGRVQKAPENFLTPAGVRAVHGEARAGRRDSSATHLRGAGQRRRAGGAGAGQPGARPA